MQQGSNGKRRRSTPAYPQMGMPGQRQNTGYAYPYEGRQQGRQGVNMSAPQPMMRNTYSGSNGYIPPDTIHRVQAQQAKQKRRKKKTNRFGRFLSRALMVVLIAGAAVLAALLIRQGRLENELAREVSAYDGVFVDGVWVDGINLSGMPAQAGYDLVMQHAQSRNDAWQVNLSFQGSTLLTINAQQLGMQVNVNDVMQEAWGKGHTGDYASRKREMEALKQAPWKGYTALPDGNSASLDRLLGQVKAAVDREPQNAVLVSFNPELSYPFEFQNEVIGYRLDTAALKDELFQMVSTMTSGTVELTPTPIYPDVTVASLQNRLAIRASVYTPISKDSTENRNNNIRRCFQKINGFILGPGKKFSFNTVVGQRTLQNGFYEAIEYAYGEHQMGVGGGACQASTTVYQAAVIAGLTIRERSPHSDSVSYAAYGEDATVYWEGKRKIDMVFTNSTDSDIYIVAKVEKDPSNKSRLVARCTIYGLDLGNTRYELVSEEVEVLEIPLEPVYKKDTKGEYVRYTDQEHETSQGKEGHVVTSYRVTYVDGVETARKQLYTDTYKAQPRVIYRGVEKRTN